MLAVLRHAAEQDVTVVREGVDFGVTSREITGDGQLLTLRGLDAEHRDVYLPLHGAHMAQNAAVALAAGEAFAGSSRMVTDETIRRTFGSAASPGRLEVMSTDPTVIVDGRTIRPVREPRPARSSRRTGKWWVWCRPVRTRTCGDCWRVSSRRCGGWW
jgi:folylpolyglutamate synthase/dihydropteroate synthase